MERMSVREDLVPVRPKTGRGAASSATSTKRQRDAAFHAELERLAAWARTLLDATPDIIDSPMIRERRAEAARAVLDVVWAVIAERNAMEGEPHPVPGLIAHLAPP
jgi:hypothetical protein